MTEPVVAALALRDDDDAPLALAVALARWLRAPLAVVHSYPYDPLTPVQVPAYEASLRGDALAGLRGRVAGLPEDVRPELHARPAPSAARGLHEAAEALDAALLVVGSTHRGRAGRVLPGGVGERLLHGAPCALAFAPRGYEPPGERPRRVGVAFVDTPEGREALDVATGLALLGGATLSAFTVLEPAPHWAPHGVEEQRRHRAELARRRVGLSAPEELLERAEILGGDAADALAAVSSELDLLVCGSRGYGPLRAVLAGSVSARLAHGCACPLLVIPRGPAGRLGARRDGRAAPEPSRR